MVNNSAPSSHALRNPTHPVQESRPRKGNDSGASKASKALQAALNKSKKIEYDLAIDEIFVERNKKIAELATRFNKDVSEVRATVCCVSRYKAHRKPTLRNGVAHQRSLDFNEQGITKSMKDLYVELDAEVDNGTFSYKSIDKVEEKRLVDQVLESCAQAKRGPRATMKAAQVDGRLTAKRIGDELLDLFERMGIRGLAFFTRGHADDPSRVHCVDSDDALEFFTQGLDMMAPHFLRKFEQWSCTLDEGTRLKNGSTAARKDVSRLMTDRLRKASKNPKAKMDYVNYDRLRGTYGVELTGNVPRSRPATWNVDTLRLVRDGLVDGTIDFVLMTPAQMAELAAEQKARVAAGGTLWGRAERSDKHKKRGPHRAKAKATGGGGKKSKSKAVGSDEDSSSSEDNDEEGDDDDDSSDEEPAVRSTRSGRNLPTAMAPGADSAPAAVASRATPRSDSIPPSPGRVLLGCELMQDPPRRPFNPATYFGTTPIANAVPVSNAMPVPKPVPEPTAATALSPDPAPMPAPTTVLLPNPAPVFRAADTFINDYNALGVDVTDGGFGQLFQPEDETHMPPLPSTFSSYSGMNDYMGWDMGMPMGMGPYRGGVGMNEGMAMGTCAPSPMWPVLNMPPLSPPAAEKRGREEGGDGGSAEPTQKKRRKENAAAARARGGTRAMRGGRGRGARGARNA